MNKGQILIVEDDYRSCELFKDILEADGYQILSADSGQKALKILESERPDLILMDILLPDINGLEVVKLIKTQAEISKIPIIAVTALAMEKDMRKCLAAGCNDYITKPIDTIEFISKIEKCLENRTKE